MTGRSWTDLTTEDFAQLNSENTVAVLPVGAIEQHGPHLPVGVDSFINFAIVQRAMPLVPDSVTALFLPLMQVGKSDEHEAFLGTLTVSYETLARAWTEIGRSVYRAGIQKLLFFNSHGGQPQVLELVCRDLRRKFEMFATTVSWLQITQIDDLFDQDEIRHGIHGGCIETSMMLHLHPGLVRLDRAEHFRSLAENIANETKLLKLARFGWQIQDLNIKGACGNAASAKPELGKIVIDRASDALAKLVVEIADHPLSHVRAQEPCDKTGPSAPE